MTTPETFDPFDDLPGLMRAWGIASLTQGKHAPPNGECQACARELAFLATITPRRKGRWVVGPKTKERAIEGWTDSPERSATDKACQRLNDGPWSSDEARTKGCLPLVSLREADAQEGWVRVYAKATIRVIAPLALRLAADVHPDARHKQALRHAAARCEVEGTQEAARAAARASRAAALAALAADAADAADVAARASRAAALAALAADVADVAGVADYAASAADDRDAVLTLGVTLLVASHRQPEPWNDPEVRRQVEALTPKGAK